MSKTPDFEQIVRPLVEKLADTMDPDNAAAFVDDIARAIWNARGAADATAVEARLSTLTGWVTSEPYRQYLRASIADLDR
jgi:hypothetical protein